MPQNEDGRLENFVDNIGACTLDPAGEGLRLQFQIVSLFSNADVSAFVLTNETAKTGAVLRPNRLASPGVGGKYPDIAWSGTSRFAFDEKVVVAQTPETLALYCLVESVDEPWYLAQYPDVAEAVRKGALPSARHHFLRHGYAEGRKASPAPGKLHKVAILHLTPAAVKA